MKREFSFYEFVGLLVPSSILLFFCNEILRFVGKWTPFDLGKIGDSAIFVVIAYGLGHLLHAFGNMFESIVWGFFRGKPTQWLTKEPRFGLKLLDEDESAKVKQKIHDRFGEVKGKDYGRIVYTHLFSRGLTARIDIFNGNYSLFRGMTVSLVFLAVVTVIFVGWQAALIPLGLSSISTIRMIRFAKYYAAETYRTFLVAKLDSRELYCLGQSQAGPPTSYGLRRVNAHARAIEGQCGTGAPPKVSHSGPRRNASG